jgi:uncharacterized membrane protein YczE
MRQKRFFQDLTVVTLASAMIGAATCCYVRAGLGSDSVAVFNEGLSIFAKVSLGTAAWCLNVALLVTAFFLARRHIGWTTICNSLLIGPSIDLMDGVLAPVLNLSTAVGFRVVLFAAGLVLVASSCALLIRKCPGMSVNDAIATAIAEKLSCSFRTVRTALDGLLMAAGFLMGGVVGMGSVAAVLCTGPLIQFFVQFGKKS